MITLKDIRNGLLSEERDETTEKVEMAETQLHFICYAAKEILEYIKMGGEIEEWYQNKLSKVHSDVESLHSYVEGEKRRTGMVDEEVEQVDEAPRHKHLATFMPDDDSGEKGPIHVPVDAEDGELAHHQKLQSIIGRERAKKYRLHGVFPRKTVEESNQGIEEVEQIDESLDKDVDKYAHHAYSAHVAYSENDGHVGDDHRATARDILKSISSEHGHVGVSWAQARADQLISDYNRGLRQQEIDATKQSYIRNRNLVPLKEYRNRTR